MKRIPWLLLLFCTVFFSLLVVISAGRETHHAVYQGKSELIIERKNHQSANDYVQDLDQICQDNGFSMLHCLIHDASLNRPLFCVYTTSMDQDFIPIRIVRNDAAGNGAAINGYYTTDFHNGEAAGWIAGLPVFEDFEFRPLKALKGYNLAHSRFFVSSSEMDHIKEVLSDNGYTVFAPDAGDTGSADYMNELWRMFILVNLVFLLSIVQTAFDRRKEIVVKKINGYGAADIFATTFLRMILGFSGLIVVVWALLCISIRVFYPLASGWFIARTVWIFFLYILCIAGASALCCFLIQSRRKTDEIRGSHPDRVLYSAAIAARVVVTFAVVMGMFSAHYALVYMNSIQKAYRNSEAVLDDFVTLSLNEGSTMLSSRDDFTDRAFAMLKELSDSHFMLIIDSGEYFTDENDEQILFLNKEYFDMHEVYDREGNCFRAKDFAGMENEIVYLLPDTIDSKIAGEIIADAHAWYYRTPQDFHTYNAETVEYTQGLIRNPIISLTDDEYLYWSSEYIIGEQFLMIRADQEDMYQALRPVFEKTGMDTVVLEAPRIRDVFLAAIASEKVRTTVYTVFGVFCLLAMLMITFFESALYYSNNKRLLAIRKLHGYGLHAYRNAFIIKLVTAVLLIVAVVSAGLFFRYLLLALIVDFAAFLFFIRRMEQNDMALYLKGDF